MFLSRFRNVSYLAARAKLEGVLTLCLLVLPADNFFANCLDPDQARQNVGPDLDPNRLTL